MNKFFILLVFLLLFVFSCKEEVLSTKPQFSAIVEAVYASATVQPAKSYTVFAESGGMIEQKFIEEGDTVVQGQVLFKIKSIASDLNVENAQLNYQLLSDNFRGEANVLKELQKQLEVVGLKLRNDSLLYAKQSRLWEQGIGAQNDLQNRQLAYEISQREYNTLLNQIQRMQVESNNQLRIAQNQVQRASVTKQDFTIASKLDGVVYEVAKELGELVLPQQPLAIIGTNDDFIIELLVDERDISKVALHQKVLIRLDAQKSELFEATITKIAPKVESRTQTFVVESRFTKAPTRLYMGLSGEANIVIAQKQKALTIPLAYLTTSNTVLTEQGEIRVETGLRSLDKIEVLSALDTAMVILKPQ